MTIVIRAYFETKLNKFISTSDDLNFIKEQKTIVEKFQNKKGDEAKSIFGPFADKISKEEAEEVRGISK